MISKYSTKLPPCYLLAIKYLKFSHRFFEYSNNLRRTAGKSRMMTFEHHSNVLSEMQNN